MEEALGEQQPAEGQQAEQAEQQQAAERRREHLRGLQAEALLAEVAPASPALAAAVRRRLRWVAARLAACPPAELRARDCPFCVQLLGAVAAADLAPLPFRAPAAPRPVGSFAYGGGGGVGGRGEGHGGGDRRVDVALRLPAGTFRQSDFKDHRYFAKRALYLRHVGRALLPSAEDGDAPAAVTVAFPRHDPRRPALELAWPAEELGGGTLTLVVYPTPGVAAFPLGKLAPRRNNVKAARAAPAAPEAWDAASEAAAGRVPAATDAAGLPCTPAYSAAILEDAFLEFHTDLLGRALAATPAARDAAVLLGVWARQHGVSGPADGLSGFALAMLCADLVAKNEALRAQAPLQLFRSALVALAALPGACCDGAEPFRMAAFAGTEPAADPELPEPPSSSAASSAAGPRPTAAVLLDPTGWVNLAAGASRAGLEAAAEAARRTLALLDGPAAAEAAFHEAFLRPRSAVDLVDHHLRLGPLAATEGAEAPTTALFESDATGWRDEETRAEAVVAMALGTRAAAVRAHRRRFRAAGGLAEGFAVEPEAAALQVGVRVAPAEAARLVDLGPDAEDAACKRFRRFWGKKAELRKFKDGKIAEAAVWELPPQARPLAVVAIAQHALARHLPGRSVSCASAALAATLDDLRAGDCVESERAAGRAFTELGYLLRNLRGTPLRVVAVQALEACLRHTDPFPPAWHPLAGGGGAPPGVGGGGVRLCVKPIRMVATLEGSGRWPSDPTAFAKTKAAAALQIAGKLQAEHGVRAVGTEEHLDIFHDGFVFRMTLETTVQASAAVQARKRAKRETRPAGVEASHFRLAGHHDAVAALVARHPPLAAVVQMAKCWVGSRMFSAGVSDLTVELLAAAAFAAPSSVGPPGSQLAGFLRFLDLLAHHDWRARPLLLDLAGKDAAPSAAAGPAAWRPSLDQFEELRRAGGGPAACIATLAEPDVTAYTHRGPAAHELQRLRLHARVCLAALRGLVDPRAPAPATAADVAQLFAVSAEGFDAVLTLHREAVPHGDQEVARPKAAGFAAAALKAVAKKVKLPQVKLRHLPESVLQQGTLFAQDALLVGADPAADFVRFLAERFRHVADVSYNFQGGTAVGIAWKPAAFLPKPAQTQTAHQRMEVLEGPAGAGGEAMTVPDVFALLQDAVAQGHGLVKAVALCESVAAVGSLR